MNYKKCNKCNKTLELKHFLFRKDSKKYRNECKRCKAMYLKNYRNENKKLLTKKKKVYYGKHRNEICSKVIKYYYANKSILNKKKHERAKERMKTDTMFRIQRALRSRLNRALRGNYKCGSAIRDLGCSISEFKKYLESLWQKGMSWDNYGRDGWHIDHIKPLSAFDLTDRKQIKKACHYVNLQPLWAKDNLSKSNKLTWLNL